VDALGLELLEVRAGSALLLAVLPTSAAVAAGDTAPFVSAHRGGAAYAPENTLVAFENAVRLGVDEIEMDAQLTADGHVVIIHDDTLDRTTDCTGTVIATTLADLQQCDAAFWFSPGQPTTVPAADAPHPLRGAGVRIPTVAEVLDWQQALGAAAPRLSIEIKDIPGEANFDVAGTAVAEVLVPLIVDRGLTDQVVVQSFWPPALEAVRRLAPDLATQFLTTTSTGQTATMNVTYATARGHDVSAPNFDAPDLTAATVAAAHAAGRQVVPWTPDRVADLAATAALGVDGIITNVPACLLALQGRPVPASPYPAGITGDPCPVGAPAAPRLPADRPDPAICAALRADRWAPAVGAPDPAGRLRVVGLQFKQDVRHVETYDTFRTKMRCLDGGPRRPGPRPPAHAGRVQRGHRADDARHRQSRGAAVREQATSPLGAPAGDAAPAGIAGALVAMNAAYAPQVAAYQARFGPIDPRKQVFVAATDTFARAFSQTFSDIARDYGVYVVATNNQARYEASRDPLDIALFADPDLEDVDRGLRRDDPVVTNQTVIWGPDDVDPDAPAGERNLLFRNDKVPLTSLEQDLIGLDEGPRPARGARQRRRRGRRGVPPRVRDVAAGLHLGAPVRERPADLEPCADTRLTFMPCMDALGVDTVIQAEANPTRWADYQAGGWQPLEWMESTFRSVVEPTVGFRYNVTPHMVGNLLDLVFDGQSAITARGATAPPRHYVGTTEFDPAEDPAAYERYVGSHPEFLALADWVVPDAPRSDLRAVAARLAPGSGDPLENDYLETAVWADLGGPAPVAPPPGVPADSTPPLARPPRSPLPATGGTPVAVVGTLALLVGGALHRRRAVGAPGH
jgi:glycerophosphoryl diester phosphodiesterase